MKQPLRRLYSLSQEEMLQLSLLEPSFLFEYLPWMMLSLRSDWVIKYEGQWLLKNCPSYLLVHCTNEELSRHYPELMFVTDPFKLVTYNSTFLIQHKRDWVEAFYPGLLKDVSTLEYRRSSLLEKGKRSWKHTYILLYRKTIGSFFGLFTHQTKHDALPEKNPYVNAEIMRLIEIAVSDYEKNKPHLIKEEN